MLCVRQSFFKGAMLRFVLELPIGYPNEAPKVRFTAPLDGLCPDLVDAAGYLAIAPLLPWDHASLCDPPRSMPLLALLRRKSRPRRPGPWA